MVCCGGGGVMRCKWWGWCGEGGVVGWKGGVS